MNSYKDDLVFFFGLVSGAVVGGVLAAFMLPRGIETEEALPIRGLTLTDRTDDAVARAQQVADATMAKVQRSAHEIIDNAVNANVPPLDAAA